MQLNLRSWYIGLEREKNVGGGEFKRLGGMWSENFSDVWGEVQK